MVSCVSTISGQKICDEESWSGSDFSVSDFDAACQAKNGTVGTSCDRTGAAGGCKTVATNGTTTVTTTSWFYVETTQDIQTACAASNGTFVSP